MIMESTIFWNLAPCSPVEGHDVSEERSASIFSVEEWAKEATSGKTAARRVSTYTSTLKMEAVCSYGTPLNFYPTARRRAPYNSTVHVHVPDNLKPDVASCLHLCCTHRLVALPVHCLRDVIQVIILIRYSCNLTRYWP
jgi:hypothetical protein